MTVGLFCMTVVDFYKGEITSNAVAVTFNAVAVTLNVSVTTYYVSVPEEHAVSRDSEQKKHLAKHRIIYPDNRQPTTKY